MRVLQVRSTYSAGPGGEDRAADTEAELLEQAGVSVQRLAVANKETNSGWSKVRSGLGYTWSTSVYQRVRKLVISEKPDIVHFHNLFYALSPSALWAARRAGAATVMTAHNYRLVCPRAVFFRDGAICIECAERGPWASLLHGCTYRGSRGAVAAITASNVAHRALGTYRRALSLLIILNEFSAHLFEHAGVDRGQMFLRPNSLGWRDLLAPALPYEERRGFCFVGQLIEEKGIALFADPAVRGAFREGSPLRVVGAGPLERTLGKVRGQSSIELLGRRSPAEVRKVIGSSKRLIMASTWYEGCPMVAIEALAEGTPLILPALPSLLSLFGGPRSGAVRWFVPGDASALRKAIDAASSESVDEWSAAASVARAIAVEHFSAEVGTRSLLAAYHLAVRLGELESTRRR